MSRKIVQIHQIGDVTLVKNQKSKRLKLHVKPDKQVIVSLPYLSSFKTAAKFAEAHTEWILKQQKKIDSRLTLFKKDSIYNTKYHSVKIIQNKCEKPVVKHVEEIIEIHVPETAVMGEASLQEYINHVITEVYRFEAKRYLPGRIRHLAALHGFSYNKVTIRNNRSNWGSCSGRNNISLNLHLMKLPYHLIDFILLHELTHTVEKNHGKRFHEILGRITEGKSQEWSKEVKKYSTYTF
ncbi:MAG: M48 family metallopeptidase [Chlorobi bacterium]|nr:M48 family metallopeptidase [Chlorobiota bacterium]